MFPGEGYWFAGGSHVTSGGGAGHNNFINFIFPENFHSFKYYLYFNIKKHNVLNYDYTP